MQLQHRQASLRTAGPVAQRVVPRCAARPSSVSNTTDRAPNASMLLASLATAGLLLIGGPSWAKVSETTAPGTNLGYMTNDEIEDRRKQLGFVRAFDGKVAVRDHTTSALWDVKLDLKSSATLLLRSPEGQVHVLGFKSLRQIDLSDDEVVGAIASSPWEKGVEPIEGLDEDQKLRKLELTREGFYQLISVIDP
ncbi:hypothetical protein V8C86DRAFT_2676583 [Haematococcus lacustris]